MKILLLIVPILFSSFSFTQSELATTKDNKYIYPLTKKVNNFYGAPFLKKLYNENLRSFEGNKQEVIKKMSELSYIQDRIKSNPDYLDEIEKSFSYPHNVYNYFTTNNITFEVDGVSFQAYDTSFYRKVYDHRNNNGNRKIKETTISWNLKEFDSIPTSISIPSIPFNSMIFGENVVEKDVLLDGEYVMYYEPIYDNRNQEFITNIPFCNFKIKNGTPHGLATYFTTNGDTLATGNYSNGIQQGNWYIRLPYYSEPNSININYGATLFNGEVILFNPEENEDFGWCSYQIEYVNGKPDGKFIYKQDGIVRTVGFLKNKKPIGNWKMYHKNGQLANSFTFRLAPLTINENTLYPKVSNHGAIKKNAVPFSPLPQSINTLPIGNYTSSILGLSNTYFINKRYIYNDKGTYYSDDIQFHNFIDSSGNQEIYIKDDFEAFYENGQLYFKMHIDKTGQLTYFSNVFDENGNMIWEWQLNKERTTAEVIEYNNNGEVISIDHVYIRNGKHVWVKVKLKK